MTADLAGERIALIGRFERLPASRLARETAARGGTVARRLGGGSTGVVVGRGAAAMAEDGRLAALLDRAEGAGAWVAGETTFLRRLGLAPRLPEGNRALDTASLARSAGLAPRTLEVLALFDLVEAADGRYGFRDLVAARQVAALLAAGAPLGAVIAAAGELRRRAPAENPLARERLALGVDGSIALRLGDRLGEISGQLRLPLPEAAPTPLLELLLAAEAAADEDGPEAAIPLYRRYLAAAPDDAVARFNLATLLAAAAREDEARETLMAAVRLDPGLAEAWYNLAHLAEAAGRAAAARSYLDRALAVDPEYGDALYNRARLALAKEDFAAAAALYERYVALDPASEWSGRARRALRYCRLMLQQRGGDRESAGYASASASTPTGG
jgi:tetratricopeptide (TPR) repeat protein